MRAKVSNPPSLTHTKMIVTCEVNIIILAIHTCSQAKC
jgi:hypothetical protein